MTDFVAVGKAGDLKPGQIRRVDVGNHEIALICTEQGYFAVGNVCTCEAHFYGHGHRGEHDPHTHDGALTRLAEHGELRGDRIVCRTHQSDFDIRTGKPLSGPAEIPLPTYEVRQVGDELTVATLSDVQRHFWNDEGEETRP